MNSSNLKLWRVIWAQFVWMAEARFLWFFVSWKRHQVFPPIWFSRRCWELLADGMPVSVFSLKCGKEQEIYVCVGKRNEYKMRPIRFHSTSQSPNMCGLHYLNCELLSNEELETTKADFFDQAESYCVLLPYIKKHQTFSCQYAIVFDDWDAIDSHCKKSIPTIYDKLFQIDVMSPLL